MLIEKQKERERQARKGLAWRTVAQTLWLLFSAFVAYAIIQGLFDEGIISYPQLRGWFFIPRFIPDWGILIGMILVFLLIMQFFFVLGYVLLSPLGRRKSGKATLSASERDPLDNEYRR